MTPSAFIAPAGELQTSMFPGIDLKSHLAEWFSQAKGKTDNEDARVAYVYWKAYDHLLLRLNSNPHEYDLNDEGEVRWQPQQLDALRARRNAKRDAFQDATSASSRSRTRRSRSVATKALW